MFNELFEKTKEIMENPRFESLDVFDPFNTFVVSDTHIGHDKDFLYTPRGFESIAEHDKALIERWNSVVGSNDVVFHLGDLYLGKNEEYAMQILDQLHGIIILCLGNHDTTNKVETYRQHNVIIAGYQLMIKCGKWRFMLHHEPVALGNFQYEGKKYCLSGHTHGANRFENININNYNCCLDAHNMFPISLAEIMGDIVGYKAGGEDETISIGAKMHYLSELKKVK